MVRYTGINRFSVAGITYSALLVEYVEDKGSQEEEDQDCICYNIRNCDAVKNMTPVAVVEIDVAYYQGKVTIPDTVSYKGSEYVVVLLRPYSFNSEGLISINMPRYISVIEWGTFCGCINLKFVRLPPLLRYIESGAFEGCVRLDNVLILSRVSYIEKDAFLNCIGMKWLGILSIPESPKCIVEDDAFFGCLNLEKVGLLWSTIQNAKENKLPQVTNYSATKPNVVMCNAVPLLFRLGRIKNKEVDKLHYRFYEIVL